MLGVRAETDADVSRIVRSRLETPSQPSVLSDNEVMDASDRTRQSFAQFVDGAVQLTADSAWTIEYRQQHGRSYAYVLNSHGQVSAIANSSISTDDWVLPTGYGFGLILRQNYTRSRFYSIVSRAFSWSGFLRAQTTDLTPFGLCLGIEDVLVHMAYGPHTFSWDPRDGPGEGLQVS
jgi:hypothetical protein